MLGWLQRLLAGDQQAVPPGATVERDDQGRVTKVTQTLSANDDAGSGDGDGQPKPSPEPSPALAAELDDAVPWLLDRNRQAIEDHGIGLETNYDFDQGTGELTLSFPDGRQLIAAGQILGSFDPKQRTFLWSWANPSMVDGVTGLAGRLRQRGENDGEPLLTEPELAIRMPLIGRLSALAARIDDSTGLYRAVTNGHTSVFIAYRPTRFLDADGREVSAQDFVGPAVDEGDRSAAEALVARHDADMLAADTMFNTARERDGREADTKPARDLQAAAYERDWRPVGEGWGPGAYSWPSDHDPDLYRFTFTGPDGTGGLVTGKAGGPHGIKRLVYQIAFFPDGPKIVDRPVEWGGGFAWPEPAAGSS